MNTNIKGLPDDKYFTEYGWSDSRPHVVVGRTAKTVKVSPVRVEPDPAWQDAMQFSPGGFCGHVHNQSEQTWLYGGVSESITVLRKSKRGDWVNSGRRFREGCAVHFYDYNF